MEYTRQRHFPPGAPPTQGAHVEPGKGPGPRPAGEASAPRGTGRLRERRKEKGDCGELQLAVCKRKYEGAELRYSRPKPAAVNANSLAYEPFGRPPHQPGPLLATAVCVGPVSGGGAVAGTLHAGTWHSQSASPARQPGTRPGPPAGVQAGRGSLTPVPLGHYLRPSERHPPEEAPEIS